ncbi:MAG: type II secretion system minor pseudopilin GspJ [Xanthomonadales bacterium]|nr:type II secretion system minor pseudopilin GspJ [Xanthomonadales bacterium]
MLRQRDSGFTLLELIIAVAVFALVAAMAQAGLSAVVRAAEANRQAAEDNRETELLLLRLDRELAQIVARPVRGAYGDTRAALIGSADRIEYSSLSFFDGAQVAPVRRGVELRGKQLVLWEQLRLDAGPGTARRETVLAEPVERLRFAFLDDGELADRWPSKRGQPDEALPRAVQLEIELPAFGAVERVIELPENPR